MDNFYQYDGDISFHGWDSFKIGHFEDKFKSELLEEDYSPLPPPEQPVRIIANKIMSSIKIKVPDIKIKVPQSQNKIPPFINTLKEQKKSNKIQKSPRPRKRQKMPTLKKKRPRRRRKKGRPPARRISPGSVIAEFLSRPGRNLYKGMSLFMSRFKSNLRRMGSGDSWFIPMLDFLKRPGDFYSNLNTSNGAGSGAGKHRKKRPKKKNPGKRPRRPRPRPGGGITNPFGAVSGVLSPVTGALGGALNSAAAAVGGAVGGAVGSMSNAASGAMQGVIGDGSLSRKVRLNYSNILKLFLLLCSRIL